MNFLIQLFNPLSVFLMIGLLTFMLSFISKRKHLLATLLSLEGLMLFLYSFFYFISASYMNLSTFVLVFLTLTACEGALGLSLLILIVRSFGGDKFNSLNFLNC